MEPWQETAVLLPSAHVVPAGWYGDPFGGCGLRYWDGRNWTDQTGSDATGAGVRRPAARRSVGLALLLALCFGGLALPYALPLPAWARWLIAAGLVWVLNWWLLLLVPLSWPFALVLVPLLTFALNRRR